MPVWSSFNFQEGVTTSIELLVYFHDYMNMFLLLILVFVSYLFVFVSFSPFLDLFSIDSHVLETVWTVVPMFVLLFIAFPSLHLLYFIEEVSSPSVTIKVIAHQWYWEYQYFNSWCQTSIDSYIVADSSVTELGLYHNLDVDNRLILPVYSAILFLVSSADVLHSWTVPSLGIKVDSIPGRLNYLTTLVQRSGVYYGQCREICGSNHSFMPICVEFIPIECFISFMSSFTK